ncbi:unnamed protein product [Phyllotreta striolata]|uniref:asparagine--tRNA ligase n=1 Tax=Phyllotreta striolata TaxID=444603 RepID=A0A9P0DFP9_PHYSR|nr:unnamed protein product [Phyllotreta striolata]
MFKNMNFKLFHKYLIHDFKRKISQLSINSILQSTSVGDKINAKGWIRSLRKQKENVFIDISDGSTNQKLQIIVGSKLVPKNLTTGASISTSGVVQLSPKGQKEINAQEISIYGDCIVTDGYPFAPRKEYTSEYIRQHLHFRPRTNKFSSLLRIRSSAQCHFHNYLTSQGYVNIHTPILTSNDCEGAGEIFQVIPDNEKLIKSMKKEGQSPEEAFFNGKTFLSVSGQLHLESAAHALTKVYNLGPIFRAENSRSRLHLAEFYMLEAEIAFLENLEDLVVCVEDLVQNVTKMLLDSNESDIMNLNKENKRDFSWMDKKFVVLTYEEAENILIKEGKEYNPIDSISKENELFLVKHCGNIPVFVINWPKNIKPFYMKECPGDNTKVQALDLLVPDVGEVVGGSLRENDFNKLVGNIPNDSDELKWYFDLRKFGGVPTCGYGLGFERYLLFVTGITNIKDVIPFPRWPHNCSM